METSTAPIQDPAKQALRSRLIWFLAGAAFNYVLISVPFHYLETHSSLPRLAISACSMGISTSVFFVWNYFVNFRTDSRKRDALKRYAIAALSMMALSTLLLTALKSFNLHLRFNFGRFNPDLDVLTTQAALAGLKFFIYHKWAFPVAKTEPSDLVP